MAQIRFDGIYHHDDIALWLRFHPGYGASGRFIKVKTTPTAANAMIGEGLGGFGKGAYELDGDVFKLELRFPFGIWRYSGKVLEDGVELKYLQEGRDHEPDVYAFHPLTDSELEPPQVTKVHQLRQGLTNGSADRTRVLAAAAIGDPVSTLALQPYLETEQVAQHFAGLGAPACVRLLLALAWSDDGVWYTPKQGVVTGGSRKDEEGKTLRALAKWCLKPDDKLFAKAEQELAEVVKVGPAFLFLDAVIRVGRSSDEAARRAAMSEALTLHLAQDPAAAYELARARVLPWLMGTGDPLAEMLKQIK